MSEAQAQELLLGMLLGLLLSAMAAVFIGGLVLKAMARLIARFSPPYLRCCLAILLSMIGGTAAFVLVVLAGGLVLGAIHGANVATDQQAWASALPAIGGLALLLALAINTGLIRWLIVHPDGDRLGLGQASLITLALLVLGVVMLLSLFAGLAASLGPMGLMPR